MAEDRSLELIYGSLMFRVEPEQVEAANEFISAFSSRAKSRLHAGVTAKLDRFVERYQHAGPSGDALDADEVVDAINDVLLHHALSHTMQEP